MHFWSLAKNLTFGNISHIYFSLVLKISVFLAFSLLLAERLFGGEYGSVAENQLEGELDELEAHRARILEANFKWRQAQMMLEYACKQLAVAVQKWQDLPTIPTM